MTTTNDHNDDFDEETFNKLQDEAMEAISRYVMFDNALDPYGAVMSVVCRGLELGLSVPANMHMSQGEYNILANIARRVVSLDPHVRLDVR